jgi:hypothetical protein
MRSIAFDVKPNFTPCEPGGRTRGDFELTWYTHGAVLVCVIRDKEVTMRTTLCVLSGGLLAAALVLLALYGWQHAVALAELADPARPAAAVLAVRSGAVAAAALGQLLLLILVVGRLYPRRLVDEVLRLGAGLVAALAFVGAVALAIAGR